MTEANAWQTATNDWRITGNGLQTERQPLPGSSREDQLREQGAIPPDEQRNMFSRLLGDITGLGRDIGNAVSTAAGAVAGAVSGAYQSVTNYADHGVWETNAEMHQRQMGDFADKVSDLMDNFATDKRAVTNEKLDDVMAMAEELGLDTSAIESEIRARQGAVDAEWADRAEAQAATTVTDTTTFDGGTMTTYENGERVVTLDDGTQMSLAEYNGTVEAQGAEQALANGDVRDEYLTEEIVMSSGTDLLIDSEYNKASFAGTLENPTTWLTAGALLNPATLDAAKNIGAKVLGASSTVASYAAMGITGIFGFQQEMGAPTLDDWLLEHPMDDPYTTDDLVISTPDNPANADDFIISNPVSQEQRTEPLINPIQPADPQDGILPGAEITQPSIDDLIIANNSDEQNLVKVYGSDELIDYEEIPYGTIAIENTETGEYEWFLEKPTSKVQMCDHPGFTWD